MTTLRTYKVNFTAVSAGEDGQTAFAPILGQQLATHGQHLQKVQLEGEWFQVRDLVRMGQVWRGTFAHLRPDAPHVVDGAEAERQIELRPDEHVLDKCHLLLHSDPLTLVWQVNKAAGGLAKFSQYLSSIAGLPVRLPLIQDTERLDRVLAGDVYELQFAYARPAVRDEGAPQWSDKAFDMLADIHAARGQFRMTADQKGSLGGTIKRLLRSLAGQSGFARIKVRLTDETDLMDIATAPLKDTIRVELIGRYPLPQQVFQELEAAYDRRRQQIRSAIGGAD